MIEYILATMIAATPTAAMPVPKISTHAAALRKATPPLRPTIAAFYQAPKNARMAFVLDACILPDEGGYAPRESARAEWLKPHERHSYDQIDRELTTVYLADPRDSAVERVQRDFCNAVTHDF